MRRLIILLTTLGLYSSAFAQERQLQRYQYWFDQDQTMISEQSLSGLSAEVNTAFDASNLSEGIHTLYLRVGDSEGGWSPLHAFTIFVTPLQSRGNKSVTKVEYWIDDAMKDRLNASVSENLWSVSLDASTLTEGIHILYYRLGDNYGQYGPLKQALFMKQQQKATQVTKLNYWWSNRTDLAEEVAATEQPFSYATLLNVPNYARRDELTDKGIAQLTIVATDNQGRQSAPLTVEVIYARFATLTANATSLSAGEPVTLNGIYEDEAGVRDYSVYYAKGDGPFILWKPATTDTSAEFKGEKGTYRFTVVARNNLGQRTSLDDEASVKVTFE